MKKPLAALFDIDETLVSTGGAGAASWHWAFDQLYAVAADIGQFTTAGMTDPVVARLTFEATVGHEPSALELATVMATYLDRLPHEVEHSAKYHVLAGVEDLLRRLTDRGVLLGVTSGAVDAAARIKLARAGLNRYLPFGGYGSDSKDRVELTRMAIQRGSALLGSELSPDQVAVVGDTPKDIEAGRGAGALTVGVASGHYSVEELRAAGADAVLGSLLEPFPWVEQDGAGGRMS